MSMSRSEKSRPPDTAPADEDFPEGGYGWVCVLCIFLINAHTWGINSVTTPLNIYYVPR